MQLQRSVIKNWHTSLIDLIASNRYAKIAEIGVFQGRTAFTVLEHCPWIVEYWMVDHWHVVNGERIGKWGDGSYEKMYRSICRKSIQYSAARVIRMPSVDAAALFPNDWLDLVYIDADHGFNAVVSDILAWMPKIKDMGTICGHDYKNEVKRAVNKCILKFNEETNLMEGGIWFYRIQRKA